MDDSVGEVEGEPLPASLPEEQDRVDPQPLVEMRAITKRFPGVVANEGVNLAIYPGEIHALLGENGAGKSTLMNVLAGLYRPDEGKIVWRGQAVDIASPRAAFDLGIGMVDQHFMLVKPMTVADRGLATMSWRAPEYSGTPLRTGFRKMSSASSTMPGITAEPPVSTMPEDSNSS